MRQIDPYFALPAGRGVVNMLARNVQILLLMYAAFKRVVNKFARNVMFMQRVLSFFVFF